MIIRNLSTRHARIAFAQPAKRVFRSISSGQSLELNIDRQNTNAGPNKLVSSSESIRISSAGIDAIKDGDDIADNETIKDNDVAERYRSTQQTKQQTGRLGSVLEPFYKPGKVLANPPAAKDVTLELLMASQSHMGHSTSLWNPANQRYIFGIRQGIHIISLEVTAVHLRRAAKVVEGVAYHGGLILFVGTRPGQEMTVVRAAQLAGGCHLFSRWVPGSITNSNQILSNCRKKIVDHNDKEMEGYEEVMQQYNAVKPDLVVCLNPLENYVCLHECGLNNIPTIAIIDTDVDPTWVTYPIPANDDSLRCVQVIAGVLGRAGQSGKEKRLEAAKSGVVAWETPANLMELVRNSKPSKESKDASLGAEPQDGTVMALVHGSDAMPVDGELRNVGLGG